MGIYSAEKLSLPLHNRNETVFASPGLLSLKGDTGFATGGRPWSNELPTDQEVFITCVDVAVGRMWEVVIARERKRGITGHWTHYLHSTPDVVINESWLDLEFKLGGLLGKTYDAGSTQIRAELRSACAS